jgi:NADH-quinone oxidoreductase subunit L
MTLYQSQLLLILLLPLAAFFINGLFGRWLKELGGWIAVISMGMSAAFSMLLLSAATANQVELPIKLAPLWEWISVGSLSVSIGLHYDQLTAVMCFVVTFVGSLVFLYSIGYMKGDPGFNRFFAYLSLFAFSMLILILGDSFPLLFVGWEGVGLCSYLLIGYYLDMPGAPSAGKKAFIVNRIGDAGFLIAMFLIFKYCGTLDIARVVEMAPDKFEYAGAAVTTITLLLFLGCAGKSAQIPLFTWLPDAMAGPTPVSALIHAATMVTAGVYLVARASVLFALSPAAMMTVASIGAATAFVAGTIALTQRDIKKVLAYSTVSQLGYMFLACGVGAFGAGIFHVFTHAFFKGCLFLGAGAVIHALHGRQDLFGMGGLRKHLPATWLTFLAATLAISGFPLTAGFFSKDEILWKTFSSGHPFLYFFAVVTALMTVCYSFRCLFLAFHGQPRMPESVRHHLHAPHWTMILALVVLGAGSLVVGIANVPHVLAHAFGAEGANFERFLHPVLVASEETLREHTSLRPLGAGVEIALMIVSTAVVFIGLGLAYRFSLRSWPRAAERLKARFPIPYRVSFRRWWWDDAYNLVFAGGARLLSILAIALDRFLIDGILHFVGKAAREGGRVIRNAQTGQVQAYALATLVGANILLLALLLW